MSFSNILFIISFSKIEKQHNNSSQILLIKITLLTSHQVFFSILILFPFQCVRKVLGYAIDKKWKKKIDSKWFQNSNYLFEEKTYNMHQFGIIIKFALDRMHSVHLIAASKKNKNSNIISQFWVHSMFLLKKTSILYSLMRFCWCNKQVFAYNIWSTVPALSKLRAKFDIGFDIFMNNIKNAFCCFVSCTHQPIFKKWSNVVFLFHHFFYIPSHSYGDYLFQAFWVESKWLHPIVRFMCSEESYVFCGTIKKREYVLIVIFKIHIQTVIKKCWITLARDSCFCDWNCNSANNN